MEYLTEEDLFKGIEDKLNRKISSDEWKLIRPWIISQGEGVHFSEEDLKDYMPAIRGCLREYGKINSNRPNKEIEKLWVKQSENRNDSVLLCEMVREKLRSEPEVKVLLEEAGRKRKELGMDDPIDLDMLPYKLIVFGAKMDPPGYPIPYPIKTYIPSTKFNQIYGDKLSQLVELRSREMHNKIKKKSDAVTIIQQYYNQIKLEIKQQVKEWMKNLSIIESCPIFFWDIKYIYFSDYQMFNKINNFVSFYSITERCHPALVLACLLADLPLYPFDYPKLEIIADNFNIQIYSNSPFISPKVVSRQFREVRKYIINRDKEIKDKEVVGIWPRPRKPHRKTYTLFEYCIKNDGRSWKKLRGRWNKEHPQWKYSSNKQMQIAFYKARKSILGGSTNERKS